MIYGAGGEEFFLDTGAAGAPVTVGTTSAIVDARHFDRAGLQLITDPYSRTVAHDAADSVVASTGAWHFVNAAFSANDVGGTLVVSGAANAGNNGTFTILTFVDATHVTTATTGLVNETFGVNVTLTVTRALLAGTWKIEVSNDHVVDSGGGSYGESPAAGHFTDITSIFSPAIAAVVAATAATQNQLAQAEICYRSMKLSFTASAGWGFPLVIGQLRSFS